MTGRFPARIVVMLALLVIASCGDDNGSAPGRAELLWQDAYDSGGSPGDARDVANAVAACGGRVYAVGETASDDDGREDYFHVRAYDATVGGVVWQQRIESGPGDSAREVVCDGVRVIVAGVLGRNSTVETYDAITGDPGWSLGIRDGDENEITGISLRGDRVYLASRSTITGGAATQSFVTRRALDTSSGAVVWEDRSSVNAPWATAQLDVAGERVCTLTSDQGSGLAYSVRCLRRSDGSLAWKRRVGKGGRVESEVLRFLPGGEVLTVATADGSDTSMLKAFAASDGTLLWKQPVRGLSVVVDMAATENRLLVAGVEFVIEKRSDGDTYERDISFVEGRDPVTGELLWDDHVENTQPRAIAVDGHRLVVGGVSWQSWIYDTLGGRLLVDEPPVPEPPARWMWDLAAADGRYFMVGAFFHDLDHSRNLDFAVRAYKGT